MESRELRRLARLFLRFARPHWRPLAAMTGLSVLAGLVTGIQPLVLAPAIDTALLSESRPAASLAELSLNNLGPSLLAWLGLGSGLSRMRVLAAVVTLYVLVVSAAAALSFASTHLMRKIRTTISVDIQSAMYEHMLSLSMPFFLGRRMGELASRFHWDVARTAECFDPVLRGFLESGIQLLIYGTILVKTDATLAGVVGVLALSHLGITRLLERQIRARTADSLEGFARVSAEVNEALLSIRVVKSFSAERFEHARLRRTLGRVKESLIRFSFYAAAETPLREVANAVVIAAALLVSFNALATSQLTLPGFVLFVVVARQCIVPFAQVNAAVVQLNLMVGASGRIVEIFEARPSIVDGASEAPPLGTAIALEGVGFAYRDGIPVLRDVSLEIRRGELVAIVGPSGAGKSTLADLVLRLYDPTAGRVTLDGADIRGFSQASYRRLFGVVPQEPLLFNTTIAENIAYGRSLAREEVVRAAQVANADEFVSRLPEAYDTLVGDRGVRLSGGQRQRIALARAVCGRPAVLILDEATSSLDSESERLVQEAIDRVLEGKTALVIAHRLSTVMRADKIVVLNEGRVEAAGSHAELLAGNALYERLYRAQFRDAQ